MNDNFFGNALIYKIREARSKRELNPVERKNSPGIDKNQIQFYLNYQEHDQMKKRNQLRQTYKVRHREKIPSISLMNPHNNSSTEIHPRKISVNFDLFNPKKKIKEEKSQSQIKQNFEDLAVKTKQKYLQKIEKQNKKKTEKCRMLSTFGLNIKTIQRSEDCERSPKKVDRVKEYLSKGISVKRNSTIQTAGLKVNARRNLSQNKDVDIPREKSKSFLIQNLPSPEKLMVKNRVQKMIASNNMVLISYGCYLEQSREGKLRYYIGAGNNRNLIISTLKRRWWWSGTNDPMSANFVWTQLRHRLTLQRLQLYDSQSMPLFDLNLFLHSQMEQTKGLLFKLKSHFFHQKLKKRMLVPMNDQDRKNKLLPFPLPECVHNHYSQNFMYGNKNALFSNLSSYFNYRQQDIYQIIPLTFFIDSCNSNNFTKFAKAAQGIKNAIWIVKPGQNSNRGHGIFVASSVQQIKQRLTRKKSKHTYIIQKYVTNIFLYQNRKFDIRAFMLMVTIRGVTKYYWYNQGYIRTSSEEFDVNVLSDFFVHLTNDAVQIKSDNYGKYQTGNKLSYLQFQHYLDQYFIQEDYSLKKLNAQMKTIATTSVKATYNKVDPQPKLFSFQLFGFDFIVDSQFRPWLIEINTNPSLELTSPVLQRLLPEMMENVFRIAIDPVYQPTDDGSRARSYFLYENCFQKNKFELIFDSLFDCDPLWEEYSLTQYSKTSETANKFDIEEVQLQINE